MPLPTTEERLGSPQRIVRYFTLIMSLVYTALGIWLWLTAHRPSAAGALLPLGPKTRMVLGSVFILYGLIRFVRTIRTQFRKPTPDDFS
ncbi:hypothetical protein [Hymenobacter sp. BRD67]|uniref:hypothetical protein n=1 Tax=Hymenobacter sp. BRD67 TaxID=2675877 RepID=UPI001565C20E|nr:hypothetical protein [Hymenobacter sp. BRD67]QKG53835.1 hypothetical protein GKZ67_16060 [Hymenobacter sp. BRD67]